MSRNGIRSGYIGSKNVQNTFIDTSLIIKTLIQIPDRGVMITDDKGVTEHVNECFEKFTGYSIKDLQGKKPGELLQGPKTNEASRNVMREAVRNKKPCEVQLYNYTKYNQSYYANLQITPFLTENGKYKFLGIQDPVDRSGKIAYSGSETELHEDTIKADFFRRYTPDELTQLKNIQHASYKTNIVAITKADGTITYVNDKFCEVSEYSKKELLGANHRILNSGYHSKDFYKDLWKTIASGKTWNGVIKNQKKSGNNYWADTAITPFRDAKGDINQFISISTDISEQVNARQVLNKQNEMLKEYAFINSHHIREPLTNIMGVVELLKNNEKLKDERFVYDLETSTGELDLIIKLLNNVIQGNKAKLDYFNTIESLDQTIEKIWMIDDDKIQHRINSKLLKRQNPNVKIKSFYNSDLALLKLKESNSDPDLILLDINMPELNGFEFMEMLKQMDRDFNIILLTSSIDLRDMKEASQYDFVRSFINKPLTNEKAKRVLNIYE